MVITSCSVNENIIKSSMKPLATPDGNAASIFLQQLDTFADKEVLIDVPSERIWGGRALKDSVLKVAEAFIKDIGLQKGQTVFFYCPNNDYHVIAQLAVMAAGGIYTGCDPRMPFRELMSCVEDTETTYMVCNNDNMETAVKVAGNLNITKLIVINASPDTLAKHSVCVPFQRLWGFAHSKDLQIPVAVDAGKDIARYLLSSGTTGKPKVVGRTHADLAYSAVQFTQQNVAIFSSSDVTICFEPICLILGTIVLWSGLLSGAKTLLLPTFDPKAYLSAITTYKASSLVLVPSHLASLVKAKRSSNLDTSSVKDVMTCGSFLAAHVAEEASSLFNVQVRQGYGMAEVGMISVTPKDAKNWRSIGLPLPGIDIRVVDLASGKSLGPEEVGEIRVRSPQASPAYFNNKAASAEIVDEQKFMRTGDTGYYDTNGFLYIVDRIKEVIKVEARQVAPAELEALLTFNDAVREAAVVGIKSDVHGEVPKAYVVLEPGFEASPQALIDSIASQVAEWKALKGGLEILKELPKNDGGKLDRQALKRR